MLPVRQSIEDRPIDVVGVGIGPSNLSVAALLSPLQHLTARFFDAKPEFAWHPGLLFPEATLQVSYLKDLVTLADPTSRYSFISFLFENKRLYQFITAGMSRVSRVEFNQYLQWVSGALTNLEFGRAVESVTCEKDALVVTVDGERVRTKNVVLGAGLTPVIPHWAVAHRGLMVWHGCDHLKRDADLAGLRVAVVGGGQTGAEVVYHLLNDNAHPVKEVSWISRRSNFLPLDESAFTNELFMPAYSNHFFNLAEEERSQLLKEQKLSSDGISSDLLQNIYRRLYELAYIERCPERFRLYPNREVEDMCGSMGDFSLVCRERTRGQLEEIRANVIILCTGFEYSFPPFLMPLFGKIRWENNGFAVREDFSIEWDGPSSLKLYIQNGARHKRGSADPNLSLMAWRSAVIVNSLAGVPVYDVQQNESFIQWAGEQPLTAAAGSLHHAQ
jgi:lysine N6-hydroxylase